MNPYLTPERLKIRDEARAFAMEEVLPLAAELDRQKADIPRWFLDRLAARGYFGILLPREVGGMGLGVFEYCLISEELSRAWMSVASIIVRGNGMGCDVADPDRRRQLLERSARGQWIGAAALSEPEAGSDLANVECRATLDGEEWVINGVKRWCGNALAADFISLLARTHRSEDPKRRWEGLETFIVEKERDRFPPGLSGHPIDKIGYHGMTTWQLQFDDVRIPRDALVARSRGGSGEGGGGGQGFKATVNMLNIARVHTAARAVGCARGALEDSLHYARERVQFGRPIADFQAIRFKLADMAAEVEASRQLYYYAAQLIDDGARCETECSMAKLVASDMAERVTSEGVQIHGGNGYTTEFPAERHWRDARLTKIFEGTNEIQRRIISDRLLAGRAT